MNEFFARLMVNWRTSAAGFGLLFGNLGKLFELIASNAPMLAVITSQEMSFVLMGLIGLLAKDSVVTGGDVPNVTHKAVEKPPTA